MIGKALLIIPGKITIGGALTDILHDFSAEVITADVRSELGKLRTSLNTQLKRVPYNVRAPWERYLFGIANEYIIRKVRTEAPELVLVYNSEFLIPEACAEIKKTSKLVFYLGDSPYFTPQNDYFLASLRFADLILVPDTFWISQLNMTGLNKTLYFIPGIDTRSYCKLGENVFNDEEETEILYAGTCYKNTWGYKKALLMSSLAGYKLRIYGNNAWERWFNFFPEIESAYRPARFISTERLNKMYNRTKIIPVDGNPAILNGVHLRMLEAIGAGALPLMEFREDIESHVFKDLKIDLPVIRNYNEAKNVAGYWLKNNEERTETIEAMRSFIEKKYSVSNNAHLLFKNLDFR